MTAARRASTGVEGAQLSAGVKAAGCADDGYAAARRASTGVEGAQLSAGVKAAGCAGPLRSSTASPPLVAIAHGSRDPRAAATVARLLDGVRRRASLHGFPGLRVATAYLDHAAPSPAQALSALGGDGAGTVVTLPLLLTDAYHSKTDIPAVLRSAGAALPGMRILSGDTLGPHPLLIDAMERRLAEAGVRIGDPRTAVVLASAGSTDPAAAAVVSRLARDWQALRGWRDVVPAFASAASPTPAQAVATLRARGVARVAVASYLLAPGLFADKVRDTSLAAGAAAVSDVLGAAPELADLVLRRYAAASAWLTLARQARSA
jgi:sirohydrochlorin ferrochelatase